MTLCTKGWISVLSTLPNTSQNTDYVSIQKGTDAWSSQICLPENHVRVAAAAAVLWRRVAPGTKSQRLCVSGFLAPVWCFHRDHRCCAAHRDQLLFLEENTQVRLLSFSFLSDFGEALSSFMLVNKIKAKRSAKKVFIHVAGCSISTPSWWWALGVKSASCPLRTAVQ